MAILSVDEVDFNRDGEDFREEKAFPQKSYTRTFIVVTDDKKDGPQVILGSAQLPALYSGYVSGNDSDITAVCIRRRARRTRESSRIWEVTCEYSNRQGETDQPDNSDPTDVDLQIVSWSSGDEFEIVLRDAEDNPIINAAGDPFDPPVECRIPVAIAMISRLEADDTFDPVSLADFVDAANDDAFTVGGKLVSAHEALFDGFSAREERIEGHFFWRVEYTIRIRPVGVVDIVRNGFGFSHWDYELLEHGENEITAAGAKRRAREEGHPITVNLNPDSDPKGQRLAVTDAPKYSIFKRKRKNFSPLGFV